MTVMGEAALSIERAGVDTLSRRNTDHKIDEMPAVREKLRKSVANLPGFPSRDGNRLATRRGYLPSTTPACT